RSHTSFPVIALLDNDEMGDVALKQLTGTFGLQNKKQVITYRQVLGVSEGWLEAEDLWPNDLLASFVARYGEASVLAEKSKRRDGGWHYGFTSTGKDLIADWLRANVGADHCTMWIELIQLVRKSLSLS
ncbi:MAG: hypothetical protein ACRDTE_00745, partial [Pseudonocardiaceae bacterium]